MGHMCGATVFLLACGFLLSSTSGARVGPSRELSGVEYSDYTYHVIVSADCKSNTEWQSLALYESWKNSGQPGYFTRLLACSKEELRAYKWADLCPTHVHPRYDDANPRDHYPPYNIPGGVQHWLVHNRTDAKYVIRLEEHTLLRKPITVEEFKASEGSPVGGKVELPGLDLMAQKFLDEEADGHLAQIGGWQLMHISDMRKLGPKWWEWTQKVHGDIHDSSGDTYKGKSVEYAYAFATASLGLHFKADKGNMLLSTETPRTDKSADPHVFHYGDDIQVGDYFLDYQQYANQQMLLCPGLLFPDPPSTESLADAPTTLMEKRGLQLRIDAIQDINRALLAHHRSYGCSPKSGEQLLHPQKRFSPHSPLPPTWHVYGTVVDPNGHHLHDNVKVIVSKVNQEDTRHPILCKEADARQTADETWSYDVQVYPDECEAKDGDRMVFKVKLGKTVYGVGEWIEGIFGSGMEQQVPLELRDDTALIHVHSMMNTKETSHRGKPWHMNMDGWMAESSFVQQFNIPTEAPTYAPTPSPTSAPTFAPTVDAARAAAAFKTSLGYDTHKQQSGRRSSSPGSAAIIAVVMLVVLYVARSLSRNGPPKDRSA